MDSSEFAYSLEFDYYYLYLIQNFVFDFLNQAEISFALKNVIYWAVENGSAPDQIMKSLEQMNIESDLYKAIYEIVYSSLSAPPRTSNN